MKASNRMRSISGNGQLPAPITVRASVGGAINLWYFHSPKNRRKFVFCGDLVFLQAILLEADPTVASYGSPGGTSSSEKKCDSDPHLIATHVDGGRSAYFVGYAEARGQVGLSPAAGVESTQVVIVTDTMIKERHVEIDNWIFLCAAMNRVRTLPNHFESEALRRLAGGPDGCTIARALGEEGADPALMLGTIAACVQRGSYRCETRAEPIVLATIVSRVTPS